MYQQERLFKLLEIIAQKKSISINKLEQLTFVSRSTLRRDLIQLEKENKIIRSFGEVRIASDNNIEFGYMVRKHANEAGKKYIAGIADTFITDNYALLIDSSSTCAYLVPYMKEGGRLVVITNGLHLASLLNECKNIETFITGGKLKAMSGSLLGTATVRYLDNYRADIAFISCSSLNLNGVFMSDEEQSFVKRKMIEQAQTVVLLCDHSKFGKTDYFKLCSFEEIDTIITDKKPDADLLKMIEDQGVEVLY